MTWWVWIIVAAGALLAIWLLFVVIRTPARRRAAQREKAAELRQAAEEKLASAAQREVEATKEAAAAQRERAAAEHAMEQADAVDPDLPGSPSSSDSSDEAVASSTDTPAPGSDPEGRL